MTKTTLKAGQDAVVRNVHIYGGAGDGIDVTNNADVEGNSVVAKGGEGIVLSGDFDVIKDNLVSDSATNGIHVRNSSSVEGNTVVGNNVTQDVGAAGILVAGDYNSVTANHATQNTFADILVTGNHSLVTGNSISNGIFVSSGSGFNVIGPRVDYANITTNTNPDANFTH